MRDGLLALLQNVFKVGPEEARRTGMASVYLFAAIGAFLIARTARSVLFLEIPNYREQLPLVYVLIAAAVSLTMYAYSHFERRLRRDHTNAVTLAVLAAVTLGFRFALASKAHGVYWAFYIWAEILGAFVVVQFWTMANEIFNSRQAKRLFAIIGGGGVLSNVVFGFAISKWVKALGTENLLFLVSGCLAIALGMVIALGRNTAAELTAARDRKPAGGRQKASASQKVFATRHVRLVAGVVIITYLVSTLVDYQFQVIIGDSIPGKDDRSAFFGAFFGVTGIIGGLLQFFVTARLLERFGVLVALLMLPVAMLTGSLGLATAPLFAVISGLWAVSFTKGSENVLRYTVNDTTLQLLYLPLPAQVRSRAKALIDGILKPLSIGSAGLVLALFVGQLDKLVGLSLGFTLDVYGLSWIVALALVGWLVTLLRLRKEYFKSLLQTLQRRRLNLAEAQFQVTDPSTVEVIDRALGAANVGEVLHALELLPHVSPKIRDSLDLKAGALLAHESEALRVAALSYLGGVGIHLHADEITRLLEDSSVRVRATAVLALCAIKHEEAIKHVEPLLNDPELEVRAYAVAGLIRHAGLDGVLTAADDLKRMLTSEQAPERERAAWVLGEVGVQNFYQPLVPLFSDPNEKVRQTAIIAAGRLKSPQLVPPLIRQLEHAQLASAAVNALVAHGSSIVEVAGGILYDRDKPARVRALAPKILARLQDPKGSDILCQYLLDENVQVRGAVVQALAQLRHRVPGLKLDLTAVGKALRAESQAYFELLAVREDLRLDDQVLLLTDALTAREQQLRLRMLALLGLRYPAETIDLVTRNLQSPQATTRANAVEVLDNLLANEEKPLVIPLLDDAPPPRKLQAGGEVFIIRRSDRVGRLRELLDSRDEWLQVCAATAAGAWKVRALEPQVQALLRSDSPVCRETAIVVLKNLGSSSTLREQLEPLFDDPVERVSRYARFVLDGIA